MNCHNSSLSVQRKLEDGEHVPNIAMTILSKLNRTCVVSSKKWCPKVSTPPKLWMSALQHRQKMHSLLVQPFFTGIFNQNNPPQANPNSKLYQPTVWVPLPFATSGCIPWHGTSLLSRLILQYVRSRLEVKVLESWKKLHPCNKSLLKKHSPWVVLLHFCGLSFCFRQSPWTCFGGSYSRGRCYGDSCFLLN